MIVSLINVANIDATFTSVSELLHICFHQFFNLAWINFARFVMTYLNKSKVFIPQFFLGEIIHE